MAPKDCSRSGVAGNPDRTALTQGGPRHDRATAWKRASGALPSFTWRLLAAEPRNSSAPGWLGRCRGERRRAGEHIAPPFVPKPDSAGYSPLVTSLTLSRKDKRSEWVRLSASQGIGLGAAARQKRAQIAQPLESFISPRKRGAQPSQQLRPPHAQQQGATCHEAEKDGPFAEPSTAQAHSDRDEEGCVDHNVRYSSRSDARPGWLYRRSGPIRRPPGQGGREGARRTRPDCIANLSLLLVCLGKAQDEANPPARYNSFLDSSNPKQRDHQQEINNIR